MHVSVAVPEPWIVYWSSVQVRPVGVSTLRLMLELNPFSTVSVIVAVPEEPAWKVIPETVSIVKSGSVEVSQMLLSTIPTAKAVWLLPYGELEEKTADTSRNRPESWSKAKPVEDENVNPE